MVRPATADLCATIAAAAAGRDCRGSRSLPDRGRHRTVATTDNAINSDRATDNNAIRRDNIADGRSLGKGNAVGGDRRSGNAIDRDRRCGNAIGRGRGSGVAAWGSSGGGGRARAGRRRFVVARKPIVDRGLRYDPDRNVGVG
jgi:hypothetical protein